MPLSINTNIASMTAQRSFLNSNASLEQSFERLSTGKRVNSAVDDAAGLAIGKDLESRVSGLNQAIRNANDGISMVQIAEGAFDEATTILQRMRDIAVQGSNGSLSSTELAYLETEHDKLVTALDDVLAQAKFSNIDLMDANGQSFSIQIGADASEVLSITTGTTATASASALGIADADIDFVGGATREVGQIDTTNGSGTALAFSSGNVLTLTVDSTTYAATMNGSNSLTEAITDLNSALSSASAGITLAANSTTATTIDITTDASTTGDITDVTYSLGDGSNTVSGTLIQGDEGASGAISLIDTALAAVASKRASLGAQQSQLESTVRNLANVAENTAAAAGRIMDTDYAAETANLTKAQILQQAATSILAQANAQPQSVLSLLQ